MLWLLYGEPRDCGKCLEFTCRKRLGTQAVSSPRATELAGRGGGVRRTGDRARANVAAKRVSAVCGVVVVEDRGRAEAVGRGKGERVHVVHCIIPLFMARARVLTAWSGELSRPRVQGRADTGASDSVEWVERVERGYRFSITRNSIQHNAVGCQVHWNCWIEWTCLHGVEWGDMDDQAQLAGSPAMSWKPSNDELVGVMAKYGVTAKQAGYLLATIANPQASASERARVAGYTENARTGDGGRVLKSDRVVKTLALMTEEKARVKREAGELVQALASDPRSAIQNELSEHVKNPDITPNQTRALELLGKMHGTFIDRLELDAGPHTRTRYADEILGNGANPSQETG